MSEYPDLATDPANGAGVAPVESQDDAFGFPEAVTEPAPEVEDTDVASEDVDDEDEPAGGSGSRKASGPTPAQVRRILNKAQQVLDAEPTIAATAAGLLGVDAAMAPLTAAIIAAPRTATQPIADLTKVTEADMMEAAVEAQMLGRERIKAVWSMLAAVGVDVPTMPSKTERAAIELAKVAFKLDDSVKASLADVAALLRKS